MQRKLFCRSHLTLLAFGTADTTVSSRMDGINLLKRKNQTHCSRLLHAAMEMKRAIHTMHFVHMQQI